MRKDERRAARTLGGCSTDQTREERTVSVRF